MYCLAQNRINVNYFLAGKNEAKFFVLIDQQSTQNNPLLGAWGGGGGREK